MYKLLITCALIVIPLQRASAEQATARGADTMVTVEKRGCGLIDSIKFKNHQVIKAKPGFIGGSISLVPSGSGTIESLFAKDVSTVLKANLQSVEPEAQAIRSEGAYTDGKLEIPFSRQVEIDPKRNIMKISEKVNLSGLGSKYAIAEYSLNLPLVVNSDPHLRMFAFGGEHRVEMLRMDMNDVSRRGSQNISDNRGYWPYWDIAGVLQLPKSYRVWKANHADTMAYPVEEGNGTPGWADYSELEWGMTVKVIDPGRSAPWAIKIDAREGVLSISPYPPSQIPLAGEQSPETEFAFTVEFHETSWPTEYPCELPVELYEELLTEIIRIYPHRIKGAVGTSDVQTIIHKERVQPSIALRALYRGDAWRMQGLLKLTGKQVPRRQSLRKWEYDAKQFLEYVKEHGVPKKNRPVRR